jgi:hypothetical protein
MLGKYSPNRLIFHSVIGGLPMVALLPRSDLVQPSLCDAPEMATEHFSC